MPAGINHIQLLSQPSWLLLGRSSKARLAGKPLLSQKAPGTVGVGPAASELLHLGRVLHTVRALHTEVLAGIGSETETAWVNTPQVPQQLAGNIHLAAMLRPVCKRASRADCTLPHLGSVPHVVRALHAELLAGVGRGIAWIH